MFGFDDILIGAGIGALGSAVFGQNPIQGAALGGITGGLLGGLPAGAWGGSAAKVAESPVVAGTVPSAFFAPTEQLYQGLGGMQTAIYPSGAATIGSGEFLSPNMGLINTEALKVAAPQTMANEVSLLNPAGMGGLTPMSSAEYDSLANIKTSPSIWDKISPYANVQNLAGAASVYNAFNKPTPMPQAPSGGVQRGQAPQGTDVLSLIKTIGIPERRHISLL